MTCTPCGRFPTRKLSYLEYKLASVTHDAQPAPRPLENTVVISGQGDLDAGRLQTAVKQAANANPAVNIKLQGKRQSACWVESGIAPQVRVVDDCNWDGQSSAQSDFIYATPLSFEDGIVAEFIIVRGHSATLHLIFRSLHAIMDGIGCLHFIRDVFNVLRNQPTQGSQLFISNTDLMKTFTGKTEMTLADIPIASIGNDFTERQPYRWQRLTLEGSPMWLLARVATAIKNYCYQFNSTNVRIAVPINLRHLRPSQYTTMNYAALTHIDLSKDDNLASFTQKLHSAATHGHGQRYQKKYEVWRYLPRAWFNRLSTHRGLRGKHGPAETAIVSDLGFLTSSQLSTDEFMAEEVYALPLHGSTACIISTLDKAVNITVGMYEASGNNGPLEDLMCYLQHTVAP